ncbi:RNA polymerase subunit sigma-24 [Methylobacterium sp. XJLW]|uniref:RNA polymerase sigma factor n=1 Tax=Methylobacterium sp. XJLW TaxID=739141 RepID=UPI000DAAEA2A|nr:RNA polymerase sigma factor [Methylobacterium sp. XJLW]AWV17546.1 RNA polymerase subunit sigma-24 [Methylobacterium sp. XJLW]
MRSIGQHLVDAWPRLYRYALTLTREPDAARDLMQQSALKALSTRTTPREPRAARAYLFQIVRHAWIDRIRRSRIRNEDDLLDWPDEGFDDRLIEAIAVRQAFTALDTPCRSVVTCVDVEGLSYQETAERLGIPIGTVMSRLHRARRIMLHRIAGPSEGSEVS